MVRVGPSKLFFTHAHLGLLAYDSEYYTTTYSVKISNGFFAGVKVDIAYRVCGLG